MNIVRFKTDLITLLNNTDFTATAHFFADIETNMLILPLLVLTFPIRTLLVVLLAFLVMIQTLLLVILTLTFLMLILILTLRM